ncbi:hypothetical protein E4U23_006038 [Claviceps purpurea]|nr:hypothetical protein E4U23_006038 [Claviceps purpurea]
MSSYLHSSKPTPMVPDFFIWTTICAWEAVNRGGKEGSHYGEVDNNNKNTTLAASPELLGKHIAMETDRKSLKVNISVDRTTGSIAYESSECRNLSFNCASGVYLAYASTKRCVFTLWAPEEKSNRRRPEEQADKKNEAG